MRILILGAAGLLGNTVFRVLNEILDTPVLGTVRNPGVKAVFAVPLRDNLLEVGDLCEHNHMLQCLDEADPQVVINCLSLPDLARQPLDRLLRLYALLPRHLAQVCANRGIRLIQISSDGVFSGKRGNYSENDVPDPADPYGVAKLLGEVEGPGRLILRTSVIGPDPVYRRGLLEWFLAQERCTLHQKAQTSIYFISSCILCTNTVVWHMKSLN